MNDIPAYDVQDSVPWNSESGKNLAPGREGVELEWGNDYRYDPTAEAKNITDGWVCGIETGSQDS